MKKFFVCLSVFFLVSMSTAHAIDIEEVTGRKSGVKAWLVEDHQLPIIAVRLAFQGGSEQDPPDKQGLATLMASALTEGAGPYQAQAFQEQLAERSITLNFDAERDEIAGGLKCLSDDKSVAFDLLHLALTRPRFEDKDIERLRARQQSAIRGQFGDPNWQARYALFSHIYGSHPYGYRHLGSLQSLGSITRDDVGDFVAYHLARDNVIVAVAGDMTPAELSAALDKIFVGLPAHARLASIPDAPEVQNSSLITVHREGTQSDLLFSMPGPKRDSSDWYAAEIANYILGGGGFSARLMQDVRDKKGLTYGIATDLSPSQHSGLIVGQAAIDNGKMSEAMDTIRETMRRFHDEGPTLHEIIAAKDYLTGSQPLELTSTDKIAARLVEIQRDHLGRDYLDRYDGLVRGVTASELQHAIDRWFNPDKVTWVMVGAPEGITPTFTKDLVKQ